MVPCGGMVTSVVSVLHHIDKALREIVDVARGDGLTVHDVAKAREGDPLQPRNVLPKIFQRAQEALAGLVVPLKVFPPKHAAQLLHEQETCFC
jgi:hypothetical protein